MTSGVCGSDMYGPLLALLEDYWPLLVDQSKGTRKDSSWFHLAGGMGSAGLPWGLPGAHIYLTPPTNAGSIPGSGRSLWRRHRQPAPVFLPGDPMDRGA